MIKKLPPNLRLLEVSPPPTLTLDTVGYKKKKTFTAKSMTNQTLHIHSSVNVTSNVSSQKPTFAKIMILTLGLQVTLRERERERLPS